MGGAGKGCLLQPRQTGHAGSAERGAHSAGEASPVSRFRGQRSRAGAWGSLPLCRGPCDSQSLSQAGAAVAWGMLLLAFLCFSSSV